MFTIIRDLARQNVEFVCGLLLFAVIVGLVVLSYFSPYGPSDIYLLPPDMPPDGQYWLGTTSRGQDVFWQLTTALRNTLLFRHRGRVSVAYYLAGGGFGGGLCRRRRRQGADGHQ